jgi:MFS family permease
MSTTHLEPRSALTPGTTLQQRLLVPGLIFIALVVAIISSVGAPLIPALAVADHVSLTNAQWSLTITLLVGAIATPTLGRLGDGPHRRQVIIGALVVVTVGGMLAALPLNFAILLIGRGLQGAGLGLVPLAITTARDALPADRARSAVALLSVTTVAGVGLGYPLTGVVAEAGGIRAAFWFGAAVAAAATAVAIWLVPASSARTADPLDWFGALLLGVAVGGLVLALSEGESWGWTSVRMIAILAVAAVSLAVWVQWELRNAHPLVDLRLLKNRAVLTADVSAVIGGVGMYLLLATVVRFVQTPASTGYGLGESVVVAGFVLTPFSIGSFLANRASAVVVRRASAAVVMPIGGVMLLAAMASFAFAHSNVWELVVTMTLAGFGVGAIFAVMPSFIMRVTPLHETGSAMSFNQVLRYVGFSTGSALSSAVLEAHTTSVYPSDRGYTVAALIGCALWVLTIAVMLILPGRKGLRRSSAGVPTPDLLAEQEILEEESLAQALPDADAPIGRRA